MCLSQDLGIGDSVDFKFVCIFYEEGKVVFFKRIALQYRQHLF